MASGSSKTLSPGAARDSTQPTPLRSVRDFKRLVQRGSSISAVDRRRKSAARNGLGASLSKTLTLRQTFFLLCRLLVLAATVLYVVTCLMACADTFLLLGDTDGEPIDYMVYKSNLIARYAGTGAIRQSPMVAAALGNDTTPHAAGSLFLENTTTDFAGCSSSSESAIYQDAFQREMFEAIRSTLAYNVTFLDAANSELIMPVVDCTFTALLLGDITAPRFFYLLRAVVDPDDVHILSVTTSIQEYSIEREKAIGPSAFVTMALVNDMRATAIEHHVALALGYPFKAARFEKYHNFGHAPAGFWRLKSEPADPRTSASKTVLTTCPIGYYHSSPNEQANVMYVGWHLFQDPTKMLADWVWQGTPVLRDSRGWVHLLHLYFAVTAIVGLGVMGLVMYYNLRCGKIWIGDTFVVVASPHWVHNALVLISWQMDDFWALMEFTLFTGNQLYGERTTIIYASVMHTDLLSLYISIVGVIGEVFKERIDPALALFVVGFEARISITKLFPGMAATLVDYAKYEYILGVMPLDPTVPERSPVRVWSSKPVPPASAAVIMFALFPVFGTLVFVVAYVLGRKLYRRKYPDVVALQHSSSKLSTTKGSDGRGANLTHFEFATGVVLRDCFGVVSDYDNYVYIKGMRFASADGIYTSAFVIANGKFLVDMGDLVAIVAIKLTRVRFRNVYVYDVDGNAVQQTARLLYPGTLSFRDLLRLNVKILL